MNQHSQAPEAAEPPLVETIHPNPVGYASHRQITLTGQRLAGRSARVRFNNDWEVAAADGADETITAQLPADLLAGQRTVTVVAQTDQPADDVANEPAWLWSNEALLTVQPTMGPEVAFAQVDDPRTGQPIQTIALSVQPRIGVEQSARLLLHDDPAQSDAERAFELSTLLRFEIDNELSSTLDKRQSSQALLSAFAQNNIKLAARNNIIVKEKGRTWQIIDNRNRQHYLLQSVQERLIVTFGFDPSMLENQEADDLVVFQLHVASSDEQSLIDPSLYVEAGTYLVHLVVDGVSNALSGASVPVVTLS